MYMIAAPTWSMQWRQRKFWGIMGACRPHANCSTLECARVPPPTCPPARYEEWVQSVKESPSFTLPIDDRQYYDKVSDALDYFIYCERAISNLGVCSSEGLAVPPPSDTVCPDPPPATSATAAGLAARSHWPPLQGK